MPIHETLYGRNAVREALRAGRRRLYRVYMANGLQPNPVLTDILELANSCGVPVQRVERATLDHLAGADRHHGVVAASSPYRYWGLDEVQQRLTSMPADHAPLALVLDYIQDPQNLGTLVRTAEALAVDLILIPERRAAGVSPAVVNASAGATEHVPIIAAGNLVRALHDLQSAGLWLVGLEQITDAQRHVDADLSGPLALIVGGEGKGMSRLVRETCDFHIHLPMYGQVNSLNAAVAGSVALFEIWRQRTRKTG